MSSGATRAAAAATSRDVKKKLMKLLFQENYSAIGSKGHDRYSYEDLRREYLKRLQVIHPDKINANSTMDANRRQFENQQQPLKDANAFLSKEELKKEFQELQSTWDRYEELSKSMMKVIHGDGATANFTKFGVGCSFSDNEEERALRTEITDQACRGWFASGLVSSGLSAENDGNSDSDGFSHNVTSKQKSLIDDSMFVSDDNYDDSDALSGGAKTNSPRRHQRTLIPGLK